jgi:hypothetical protein
MNRRLGGWSSSPQVRVYRNGPPNEPVARSTITVQPTPSPLTTTTTGDASAPDSSDGTFFPTCTISVLDESSKYNMAFEEEDGSSGMEIAANFLEYPHEPSTKHQQPEQENGIIGEQPERDNHPDRRIGNDASDDRHPAKEHVQGYIPKVVDDDDDYKVILIPVDSVSTYDKEEPESYIETIQKDISSSWETNLEHPTQISSPPNNSKHRDGDDAAREQSTHHETRSPKSKSILSNQQPATSDPCPMTDNIKIPSTNKQESVAAEKPLWMDRNKHQNDHDFVTTIHDLVDKIQREQAETAHLEQEYLQMEREYHETLQCVTKYLESMQQKKEAMESKNAQLKETLLGLQVARSQLLEQMPTMTSGAMCEV